MFQFLCVVTIKRPLHTSKRYNVLVSLCCYDYEEDDYYEDEEGFSFFVLLPQTSLFQELNHIGFSFFVLLLLGNFSAPKQFVSFQFLCVVTAETRRKSIIHALVLVSLCCYGKAVFAILSSYMFQFLCVVTGSSN